MSVRIRNNLPTNSLRNSMFRLVDGERSSVFLRQSQTSCLSSNDIKKQKYPKDSDGSMEKDPDPNLIPKRQWETIAAEVRKSESRVKGQAGILRLNLLAADPSCSTTGVPTGPFLVPSTGTVNMVCAGCRFLHLCSSDASTSSLCNCCAAAALFTTTAIISKTVVIDCRLSFIIITKYSYQL